MDQEAPTPPLDPQKIGPTVSAIAQLYAAERTAGQDIQRLDFSIFTILLAYIGVTSGWFVNNSSALTPLAYSVFPLPVLGLVLYLIQLMDLSKVRSKSIDYLEGCLRGYANLPDDAPLIGSVAEKSVTDIGELGGGPVTRALRLVQSLGLYSIAILGSAVWVAGCLYKYRTSTWPSPARAEVLVTAEVLFWLAVVLAVFALANIVRVFFVFGARPASEASKAP